jgi:hypothetical protein
MKIGEWYERERNLCCFASFLDGILNPDKFETIMKNGVKRRAVQLNRRNETGL